MNKLFNPGIQTLVLRIIHFEVLVIPIELLLTAHGALLLVESKRDTKYDTSLSPRSPRYQRIPGVSATAARDGGEDGPVAMLKDLPVLRISWPPQLSFPGFQAPSP
ncbi:predicted protein [Histoplasma capsulatum var. duboisii H88]|uniref:Predicted protein n=1 Tax=Ajellomyces capsulatus (strain H88) TaxID=544711 RepID=F0U7D9_AJEC8|nr:predicted protein [Histoplasma capsulatum var. duboisii H88]